MSQVNKTYYSKPYRGHKGFNIFQNVITFAVFAICTLLIVAMLCVIVAMLCGLLPHGNTKKQDLPQVEINTNFINLSAHLAYEEETKLVYIRNIYHKAQDVYSIYYDASGKPMVYNDEDIPFEVEVIGEKLVVDMNTKIVYRQEPSTKDNRKNYSAYYGDDGLLRYYENGNLYPVIS